MEEIITLGNNNPRISPELEIWGWPIALDLFLGGLAGGALFLAALYCILHSEKNNPTIKKWSGIIAFPSIIIALIALFADLHNKIAVWRLYTTVNLESPMSWGSWTLLFITPLALVWGLSQAGRIDLRWNFLNQNIQRIQTWSNGHRLWLAWPLLFLSLMLAIYTGVLLSAFNARPLWNTSVLAILFPVSGLTMAVAAFLWLSKDKKEKKRLRRLLLVFIGIKLFLLVHMFMAMLAGPEVQVEAAKLFIGGPFTLSFWGIVLGAGLIIPMILEVQELRGRKVPAYVVPLLVLIGGFIFRIIIVHAGQISSYTMG